MKAKIKRILRFILNPRLLLCFGIGWMITNGWSYAMMALGTYFGIEWMMAVAGAYLAFLWLPISPEKIVTVAIAIFLLRLLFPRDEHTLGVLRVWQASAREAWKKRKEKRRQKKEGMPPAEE